MRNSYCLLNLIPFIICHTKTFNHNTWNANSNTIIGNIFRNYRVCSNNAILPNLNISGNHNIGTNPCAITNEHRIVIFTSNSLATNRNIYIFIFMIMVSNINMGPRQDILTESHSVRR